jgi:hypothetical protein
MVGLLALHGSEEQEGCHPKERRWLMEDATLKICTGIMLTLWRWDMSMWMVNPLQLQPSSEVVQTVLVFACFACTFFS